MKLGVIGGGAMGSALLNGIVRKQLFAAAQVGVSEPDQTRAAALADALGIQCLPDNATAAAAEILILAIKPQVFPTIVAEIQPTLSANLVISIMAGITLTGLETAFPQRAVVRTMPNTPLLVGAGMTAISCGQHVSPTQVEQVKVLFSAVGSVIQIAESQMDAVTAISGSGPGYLALITEALIDGGVQAGLARPIATQLAIQTLYGTGLLLQQENLHPALLKDRVTSPGGTTIAGISVLEEAGVRGSIMQAVQAAQARSYQLRQT